MAGEIAVASELLIAFIQAWMLYQKNQGLTEEQIHTSFISTFTRFMMVSSVPVDPVKIN